MAEPGENTRPARSGRNDRRQPPRCPHRQARGTGRRHGRSCGEDRGESAEDAAVRETLEETGLWVRATGVIGSRVHPVTGVLIVYVAADLTGSPDVAGTCSDELAEVRWVCLTEAGELMDGMARVVPNICGRDSIAS
jgi:NUDIX domain